MSARDRFGAARTAFWLRACDRVGTLPRLHGRPTVMVSGGHILIGHRFRLASRPVPSHLVAGPRGVLEIGDDVSIGHGAAVAAYENVRIGGGTCLGPFTVIMDTNFHGAAGDQSVQHECRPVIIGKNCRIGTRVTITRGATIGEGSEILAGSVVSSAIPSGVCAAGARARIVGRACDASSRWDSAAVAIPEIVMQALGLEVPPELDSDPSGVPGWGEPGVQRLLAAIEDRFGVSIEASALGEAVSFAEMAAVIERVRGREPAQVESR